MCTGRQAGCFSGACASYILTIRGNNLTIYFKGACANCQKHKGLALVGILSKEGAPVAGKLFGQCDTTSCSRSSVTPGSRFQTVFNVPILYDIYPISLAKLGFDKGRNNFSAYPANAFSTPGFIMLTVAAASMMIVLMPVGILLCRLTSAWRHSTSSDFFPWKTQFPEIRRRWREILVFMFNVPGLTGDVQSCKQCTIALN